MGSTKAAGRRDWFAFDRTDRVGLTVLLWIVGAVTVLAMTVAPVVEWLRGDALTVPFLTKVSVPELDTVGTAYGEGEVPLSLADPSVGQRLADLLPGVLVAAVTVASIWLLLRVLRAIGSGDPFGPGQVRRLRVLAGLLILGPAIAWGVGLVAHGILLGGVDLGGLPITVETELPWMPMIAGLVVALVAEAFKVGSGLRDDVEGLI